MGRDHSRATQDATRHTASSPWRTVTTAPLPGGPIVNATESSRLRKPATGPASVPLTAHRYVTCPPTSRTTPTQYTL